MLYGFLRANSGLNFLDIGVDWASLCLWASHRFGPNPFGDVLEIVTCCLPFSLLGSDFPPLLLTISLSQFSKVKISSLFSLSPFAFLSDFFCFGVLRVPHVLREFLIPDSCLLFFFDLDRATNHSAFCPCSGRAASCFVLDFYHELQATSTRVGQGEARAALLRLSRTLDHFDFGAVRTPS